MHVLPPLHILCLLLLTSYAISSFVYLYHMRRSVCRPRKGHARAWAHGVWIQEATQRLDRLVYSEACSNLAAHNVQGFCN